MEDEANFNEENNFSTISNDDMNEISSYTDYSVSAAATSSLTSASMYHRNTNKYSDYSNSKMQPSFNNMMTGMHPTVPVNMDNREAFLKYLDVLTSHMVKYDPDAFQYLQENIKRHNNGEIDMDRTGRTTPLLYPEMHSLGKLNFPGRIYQLIPNTLSQTGGMIRITDEIYPKFYDLQCDPFPGPLTLDRTTEDQVRDYLKNEMSTELQESPITDWDSPDLLLRYMELLIKESGRPIVSNVVKLLNEGNETRTCDLRKEHRPFESISRNSYSRASSRAVSRAVSPENRHPIDPDLPHNDLEFPPGPTSVASIMSRAAHVVSSDQKLYNNMDKFRKFILLGKFEDAVTFAMGAGIWDHAFALALRMNSPALVNEILVRFSRRAIYANDPLFTIHELMAAKSPMIVATNRAFSNSEMSDWRSHLSMILVARRYKAEESRQAVESMGEKLMLLRSYFAAHLCFLLAGTAFGIDKSAHKYRRKFDLIGWPSSTSHIPSQRSTYALCHRQFSGLAYWSSAPQQYIKLTEVYEYVLRLRADGSHKLVSVHLLPYKYMMAYRMLASHQVRAAYDYCRDIGHTLGFLGVDWLHCESVTFTLVANVRDLGNKLHSLLSNEDECPGSVAADDSWLQNIDEVYCGFCTKLKLWNPRSTKPDFLIDQMLQDVSEEVDSLSESFSQLRTPLVEQAERSEWAPSAKTTLPGTSQPQPVPMAQYPACAPSIPNHTKNSTSARLVQPVPRYFSATRSGEGQVDQTRAPSPAEGLVGHTRAPSPADTNHAHNHSSPDPTIHSKSSAFVPHLSPDSRASYEPVDCFSSMPDNSRSRSQLNGSVSRSRHASQTQEAHVASGVPTSTKPLKATKEEADHHQQQQNHDSGDDKKPSWNPLGFFKPKQKGVFLPDDRQKALEFDPVKKKWVDKTNPDTEKPPTPPPKMPMMVPQMSPPAMAPSLYQGPGLHSGLSRYRQATPNVKPSNTLSAPLPPPGVPGNYDFSSNQLYSRSNHTGSADLKAYQENTQANQ